MISVNDVWGAFGIAEGGNHINITSPLGNSVFLFAQDSSEIKYDHKYSQFSDLIQDQMNYDEYSFCGFRVEEINVPTLAKISG